jgi:hypothetical protein
MKIIIVLLIKNRNERCQYKYCVREEHLKDLSGPAVAACKESQGKGRGKEVIKLGPAPLMLSLLQPFKPYSLL